MKKLLIGLCAFSLFTGLTPKAAAQTVTITVGPATDDSYWVWNDEYQCWVWNGPEFEGDYQGHPYSYWRGRHEGGGDRNHRPGKIESSEGERPVKGNVEQPKAEVERRNADQHKAEVEKPKAEEKARTEKPKEEQKSKTDKPKPEEKKDDSKPKGE